ncbi:MAG: AmmeMemoRadiSam system radical SAM enzyme [Deltaproteobacteria bacterium]|nr:AmmeMemoRadiSam system radical SAM enzyme [Deltaproteobacteria bacterium]
MKRRDFIKLPCLAVAGGAAASLLPGMARAAGDEKTFLREAAWYIKRDKGAVACTLCPKGCIVQPGKSGWCGVRSNRDGTYYTRVFGRPVALANDPIEKKPLNHFHPATDALSLSTVGCNFECRFCQNWEISQSDPGDRAEPYGFVSPDKLVAMARQHGSKSIAFTYGEPVVFFEYMLEAAKKAKAAGILPVMITNGYINQDPMDELLEVLAAVKVDFKAFDDGFYRKVCSGTLKPVLRTLERIHKRGVWLEMVHLTVPTLNDAPEQIERLCKWVLDHLGPDVPIHFSRFHPTYKLRNLPPTPANTLVRAWVVARNAGLHYPYVGNMPGHEGENTHCHHCGELLVRRVGYHVVKMRIQDGKCPACKTVIPGVWG